MAGMRTARRRLPSPHRLVATIPAPTPLSCVWQWSRGRGVQLIDGGAQVFLRLPDLTSHRPEIHHRGTVQHPLSDLTTKVTFRPRESLQFLSEVLGLRRAFRLFGHALSPRWNPSDT